MTTTTLKTALPAFHTGLLRYDFQIACAKQAEGIVLNVGCNEDPSDLRKRFGKRIINCDREGYDEHMNRPNVVDRIFDCLEFPWPGFDDDSAEMVLFGDILEHFPVAQSVEALREAHRIAPNVCITVPEDIRIDEAAELAKWQPGVYNLHTTVITEDVLLGMLSDAGFEPNWLVRGLWGEGGLWGDGVTVNGWCVRAHRERS